MKKITKYIPNLFAIIMLIGGIADLFQPPQLMSAMDGLNMPHYMLIILGVGKIIGSLIILFYKNKLLTEWAFAGFFVWACGGISAHIFSGHSLVDTLAILGLALLLVVSYWAYNERFKSLN